MKRLATKSFDYIKRVTLIDSLILIFLLSVTLVMIFVTMRKNSAHIIADDIARLEAIFKNIDEQCGILGFDADKNPINFLTLKKDEVSSGHAGSMKLAHPQNWHGPYLCANLTMQGKEYQIIKARQGYYILP